MTDLRLHPESQGFRVLRLQKLSTLPWTLCPAPLYHTSPVSLISQVSLSQFILSFHCVLWKPVSIVNKLSFYYASFLHVLYTSEIKKIWLHLENCILGHPSPVLDVMTHTSKRLEENGEQICFFLLTATFSNSPLLQSFSNLTSFKKLFFHSTVISSR